jgi:hypothetical protein
VSQRTPKRKLVWRFVSGAAMDGRYRTDASWLHWSTATLWPHRVVRWHHMPRLYRAGVRDGTVAAAVGTLCGLRVAPLLTLATLAAVTLAAAALGTWWLYRKLRHFRHHWRYVRPLRRKLTRQLQGAPPRLAIEPDRSKVTIWLPPELTLAPRDWEMIELAVTTTTGIEAPELTKELKGPKPFAIWTHSDPPPGLVKWADVEHHVTAAGPDELVVGIGKQRKVVKVSIKSDSPHFGISMGTGAGKSNLATFWLVQELRRGAIVLILDAKRFSHPWAFKDMNAEYGQLPNVGYARRTTDLHDAMVWLGDELQRRTEVAERIIDAKGDLHGDVGPRLWIICEEMNMATSLLKQHWAEIRSKDDPKKSPALTGMGGVSFAGRAVKMHLIVIGQQLTADSLGGGAVRENIGVRCLARYQQSSWQMLAGRDVPMPPSPTVDGRVQCIAGPTVSETQTPLMDLEQVRELAVAGVVTPCPAGMPGIAVPDRALIPVGASDLRVSQGHVPELAPGMTLSEAAREGVWPGRLAALQKASQRAGFPDPVGWRGNARIWNPGDLYAYVAGRNGHR